MIYDRKLNIEQLELLGSQYQKILQISKEGNSNNQLYLTKNREVYLPKGALIHYSSSAIETIRSISKNGILAPELFGQKKQGSTYYCADFYKIESDMLISDYNKNFTFLNQNDFRNNGIAYVINPTSKIGGLIYYDLLDSKFNNNSTINTIIDYQNTHGINNSSAILGGIPSNAISGIILGDKVVLNTELTKIIEKYFPNVYLITRGGNILKDRSNMVKIEDFENISLKWSQESIKNTNLQNKAKILQEENNKLKENISLLLNNIKKILTPFEQAKLLISIGYFELPTSLLKQLTEKEKEKLQIIENRKES